MNYVVWDCETDSAQTDWATMLEVGAILLDNNFYKLYIFHGKIMRNISKKLMKILKKVF